MADILTAVAPAALAALAARPAARLFARRRRVLDIRVRLDRSVPGAHLIWDIGNVSATPVALSSLVVHGRKGADQTLPFALPHVLDSGEHLTMPTDVDWSLLGARSIGVTDDEGREHAVDRRQLVRVQQALREHIDRRAFTASAQDWLFGVTDLAFGAVLLGLGLFLLLYVIATS